MKIETHWDIIKKIFKHSLSSSFHYSIASVDKNNKPHVTPIGSLILGKPGQAIYFEEFTCKLKSNITDNKNICVLAVNSSKWFWFKSLLFGRFSEPPAIRLSGEAGMLRKASTTEINLWKKRVRSASFTKGYKIMWDRMSMIREIKFLEIHPVHISTMTQKIK